MERNTQFGGRVKVIRVRHTNPLGSNCPIEWVEVENLSKSSDRLGKDCK